MPLDIFMLMMVSILSQVTCMRDTTNGGAVSEPPTSELETAVRQYFCI